MNSSFQLNLFPLDILIIILKFVGIPNFLVIRILDHSLKQIIDNLDTKKELYRITGILGLSTLEQIQKFYLQKSGNYPKLVQKHILISKDRIYDYGYFIETDLIWFEISGEIQIGSILTSDDGTKTFQLKERYNMIENNFILGIKNNTHRFDLHKGGKSTKICFKSGKIIGSLKNDPKTIRASCFTFENWSFFMVTDPNGTILYWLLDHQFKKENTPFIKSQSIQIEYSDYPERHLCKDNDKFSICIPHGRFSDNVNILIFGLDGTLKMNQNFEINYNGIIYFNGFKIIQPLKLKIIDPFSDVDSYDNTNRIYIEFVYDNVLYLSTLGNSFYKLSWQDYLENKTLSFIKIEELKIIRKKFEANKTNIIGILERSFKHFENSISRWDLSLITFDLKSYELNKK